MATQLSNDAEAALDSLVALSGRSREEVANEALSSYALWLQRETAAVAAARADVAAGRVHSHDEVFRLLEQKHGAEDYPPPFVTP